MPGRLVGNASGQPVRKPELQRGYDDGPQPDRRGGLTVHGFRSTFRDWVAEATTHPGELAEAALAHTIRNVTEAAYGAAISSGGIGARWPIGRLR